MNRRKLLINLNRLRGDNEFQILPQVTAFVVQENKSEKEDQVLRNRYLYIFLNSLIGIALMIIELQLSWNGKVLLMNSSTKVVRIIIFFLTLILICQLMDYYRLLLSNVTHGWLTKRARGFRVTPINVLRSTTLAPLFWAEVLVCLIIPIPFTNGPIQFYNDPKIGLLMWLRIYMFARVYRDFSHVYKSRHSLTKKYKEKNEVPPKFNWALSLKTLLYQRPLMTFIPFTVLIIFICSHIIYIFEREAFDGFTYPVSLYISFISMFTGWPTDTYDIYNPKTFFGKFGAIMSSVLGLFTLACLIEQFSNLTHPTAHQKPILNYIYILECQERERNSAAKLIQVVWKRYRWQRKHSFSSNPTIYNTQEAMYCMKYIEAVKSFGRERRYKKQIQTLVSSDKSENTQEKQESTELKQMLDNEKKARIVMENKLKSMEEYQVYIVNQLNQIIFNQQQQQRQLIVQQQQQQQQPPHPYNVQSSSNQHFFNNNNNNNP